MNRKDFRPYDATSTRMSDADRKIIQRNRVQDRKSVISSFVKGEGAKTHTSNNSLSTDGKVLKSYNTVIAVRQADGRIVVNTTKYSNTTTQQQNALLTQLKSSGTKYETTGGKDRGYEGEDFSEKPKGLSRERIEEYGTKIEMSERPHIHKDDARRIALSNLEKSPQYYDEANIKKRREYEEKQNSERRYREQIEDEHKASREYSNLAKKNPQDAKKLTEISQEESTHAKELKQLEKTDSYQYADDKGGEKFLTYLKATGRRTKDMSKEDVDVAYRRYEQYVPYERDPDKKGHVKYSNEKLYYDRDEHGVSISELSKSQQKQYAPNSNVRYVIQKGDARTSTSTLADAKKKQKEMRHAYIDPSTNTTRLPRYKVTGKTRDGKRFKPIYTSNPTYADSINLYNGSVYEYKNGKYVRIKRVTN